jgi:antitoxin component of MazEF toxin-antitoxin module
LITQIVEVEDGELGVVIPPEILARLNLKEGDTLVAEAGRGFVELRLPRADELDNK